MRHLHVLYIYATSLKNIRHWRVQYRHADSVTYRQNEQLTVDILPLKVLYLWMISKSDRQNYLYRNPASEKVIPMSNAPQNYPPASSPQPLPNPTRFTNQKFKSPRQSAAHHRATWLYFQPLLYLLSLYGFFAKYNPLSVIIISCICKVIKWKGRGI